ncbi:MAG: tRNA (adenosine(37)-N6)-threonylcarbamoyltransferase complex dimerization subunit type 1 TsaB [Actinomycetota bacterium]|nr:tRNA (adenosine(37)-N6)-threonylcarbamoyltransferase complex dimerization subunit type 1 TsaB [Actinomycetota bacterium]
MLLLVIDTSTPAVTAAAVEVTREGAPLVLAEQVTVSERRHGELLAPAIEAVLVEAELTPGDLGAVVAGAGPGPFTGLRVGLATAAATADALELPAYAVCSLDAIAYAAGRGEGRLLVATDARRHEIYWATYEARGERASGPEVSRPSQVDTGGCGRACGAGAVLYAEILGLPVDGPQYPAAAGLAALGAGRAIAGAPTEPLTPLYLRRPDAAPPVRPKAVLR